MIILATSSTSSLSFVKFEECQINYNEIYFIPYFIHSIFYGFTI